MHYNLHSAYLQVGKSDLLHRCAVLAGRGSKAVHRNEVPHPQEKDKTNREEREPVFPVRPALGAAAARAREEAVSVEVVAIALPANHATVAFARRALYGQRAERRLDARLVVGALVEQCGELDRAVRDWREPVVFEDLRMRERERGWGRNMRDTYRKQIDETNARLPGERSPRTELHGAGSESTRRQ